jgi:hypothetical protein
VISFAQSFHWMDQLPVARTVLGMLNQKGACLHVDGTTHQSVDTDSDLPHPKPPCPMIEELIERYLGPINRARKGLLPPDKAAGFAGPQRIEIHGRVVQRTSEQIVAAIFSLSGSTPRIFGDRRQGLEDDLRQLLLDDYPSGIFSEQTREIAADIWRPGRQVACIRRAAK